MLALTDTQVLANVPTLGLFTTVFIDLVQSVGAARHSGSQTALYICPTLVNHAEDFRVSALIYLSDLWPLT